ncbi:ribonuclease J [Patescibacteria group bacterium]|nr:ribonuclease J [Patescibacteria group bacterium]
MDKLSKWLKSTVQGGDTAPLEAKKPENKPTNKPYKKPYKKPQKQQGSHGKNKPQQRGRKQPSTSRKPSFMPVHRNVLRVIPIGGLEEVGKNSMVLEYEEDILVIDMGFQFPEDEMLGVDYVVPDVKYLTERKDRIKAIVITHGHMDHIGGLPYVLPDLGFPDVYAPRLAAGLIERILGEHKMLKRVNLKVIDDKQVYRFGVFELEYFHVNHSIPDSKGLTVSTPDGSRIVHTGDFKFDFTPADGVPSDIGKITSIGKRGVNVLFSDSTNATKPGHTLSERVVAESLSSAIEDAEGRIVIASFSSLIGRIQQIIDFAAEHGRKVFFSGRSMIQNVEIARRLGFMRFTDSLVRPIQEVNNFAPNQVLVITTGSQGEPMAALSRMANDSHAQVKIQKGDTVVVSASPIMGNEMAVAFLVDKLARLGARVIHNAIMDIHTSGHGNQEDLKMMMSLVRPDHLVPIHGNYYMRSAHAELGRQMGLTDSNVHLMDNGNVIEVRKGAVSFKKEDIKVKYVVVDGHGVGDLGSQVLKDREAMAENGVVTILFKVRGKKMVGNPVVITNGFVYQKETEKIVAEIEREARKAFNDFHKTRPAGKTGDLERHIKSAVLGYIVRRLDRRPLVSPHMVRV